LDCAIWTEDTDFFGVGIPSWTTDRVELFLADKAGPTLEQIKEPQVSYHPTRFFIPHLPDHLRSHQRSFGG
jgi:hypothetical protein